MVIHLKFCLIILEFFENRDLIDNILQIIRISLVANLLVPAIFLRYSLMKKGPETPQTEIEMLT